MKRFLLALAAAAMPCLAAAQAYPAKPIHIIVPFPPGGPTDVLGRQVGDALASALSATVVVENKAGAAGNLGVAQLARAAPDGYTLGIVPAGNIAVNPTLYPDLPYKAGELAPVTMLATVDNVLVVNAEKVPAHTLKELLELAAKQPGALSYASPGAGSQAHLAGALLELDTGVKLLHVPYRGIAPAVTDLLGGQVSMMFAPFQTVLPHIKSGKLRAIAVASLEALTAAAGAADTGRTGRAQIRGRVLVRADGAGQHARRDRGAPERGHRTGAGTPRDQGQARCPRHGPGPGHASGVGGDDPGRVGTLERSDPQAEHQARVSVQNRPLDRPFEACLMNLRRTVLLAALSAFVALPATAQDALRVVTDATFPPMEFSKDGKRTGFDIELTEALGAAMGRKIEWIDIDFKGLIPALVSKRADLAMSAIYITDERRKVVDFSDPYFAGGLVVLTTKAGPIKTLKDLDGKRVSVQVGTKSVGYLKDNFPKVERIEVEKNQEMFNLVEIGRADAAVTGKPAAKVFAQAKPALWVLPEQLTTEDYGIAVRKDTPELRDAVNAALKKIKADGTYDKLVQKWFEAGK